MDWGSAHEDEGLMFYIAEKKYPPGTVRRSGLFVSTLDGIFAASPDGVVGEEGIIEIKCPYSCRNDDPSSWKVLQNKSGIFLKKSHVYYCQIVMQLHVTEKQWCDFVVWSNKGIWVQQIFRDHETLREWQRMIPILTRFYENELAPEILDSRFHRSMDYRIPDYKKLLAKSKSTDE